MYLVDKDVFRLYTHNFCAQFCSQQFCLFLFPGKSPCTVYCRMKVPPMICSLQDVKEKMQLLEVCPRMTMIRLLNIFWLWCTFRFVSLHLCPNSYLHKYIHSFVYLQMSDCFIVCGIRERKDKCFKFSDILKERECSDFRQTGSALFNGIKLYFPQEGICWVIPFSRTTTIAFSVPQVLWHLATLRH